MASTRAKLSAAMLSLIAAGASAPVLFDQFISEKEGNALVAVMDPGGVRSLCHGATVIDGKRVVKGMTATEEQCKKVIATQIFNCNRFNPVAEYANRLNSLIDYSTNETVKGNNNFAGIRDIEKQQQTSTEENHERSQTTGRI